MQPGSSFEEVWQKVAMGVVTREQIADRVGRSVRTVRYWEQQGLLPRAVPDDSTELAYYEEDQLLPPGRKWSEVRNVVIQRGKGSATVGFHMTNGDLITYTSRGRRAEIAEKAPERGGSVS